MKPKLHALLAAGCVLYVPWAVQAHCGPNDNCVHAPCHHGQDTPECKAATGGERLSTRIQQPEVREAVREIVIPKVPQLNLPVGGSAKPPPNAPAPLGKLDVRAAPPGPSKPFPPSLPPSAIAQQVVPQVYSAALTATREIENQRAMEELRKNNPKLAGSAWLQEQRQLKLGEIFKELERVNSYAQQAKQQLPADGRHDTVRDSLERASSLLQAFGSGEPGASK